MTMVLAVEQPKREAHVGDGDVAHEVMDVDCE
jgi:hypothetical protein